MAATISLRTAAAALPASASGIVSGRKGCCLRAAQCYAFSYDRLGDCKTRNPETLTGGRALRRQRARIIAPGRTVASVEIPTVADTKRDFLEAYKKPIPSIYNNVIQELIVLQHLMRYNTNYKYDAVFALGFISVWDQLMDGYPQEEDKEVIFRAYIGALNEDPDAYRRDATQLEEWAKQLDGASIVQFAAKDGPAETLLKEIAERAKSQKQFHYTRYYAIGLFRMLELANASEPATLEQLCNELGVSKLSVDRDLDVYRGLLSKLSQAKELLRDFLDREKKKQSEREKEKVEREATATTEPVKRE